MHSLSNDVGDWGTFGDYIGGTLNPILGFFSFLALCYTIYLQNKQLAQNKLTLEQNAKALELNNQELKNSTEQLQLSAKAQLEMEKTQRIQQFEGLFTFMLGEFNKYNEIVKDGKFYFSYYLNLDTKPNIYNFRNINEKLKSETEIVNFFYVFIPNSKINKNAR